MKNIIWIYTCIKRGWKAYRWLAVDNFCNELSVCSVCSTEATITDHVVLKKPLDHIRVGTLYKIPERIWGAQCMISSEATIHTMDTEGLVVWMTLPVVLEHQLDLAITDCAQLKGRGEITCNYFKPKSYQQDQKIRFWFRPLWTERFLQALMSCWVSVGTPQCLRSAALHWPLHRGNKLSACTHGCGLACTLALQWQPRNPGHICTLARRLPERCVHLGPKKESNEKKRIKWELKNNNQSHLVIMCENQKEEHRDFIHLYEKQQSKHVVPPRGDVKSDHSSASSAPDSLWLHTHPVSYWTHPLVSLQQQESLPETCFPQPLLHHLLPRRRAFWTCHLPEQYKL